MKESGEIMKRNLTPPTFQLELLFRKQVYFAIQLNTGAVTMPPSMGSQKQH